MRTSSTTQTQICLYTLNKIYSVRLLIGVDTEQVGVRQLHIVVKWQVVDKSERLVGRVLGLPRVSLHLAPVGHEPLELDAS